MNHVVYEMTENIDTCPIMFSQTNSPKPDVYSMYNDTQPKKSSESKPFVFVGK